MLRTDGKKIGYYDFLHSDHRPDALQAALDELIPRIETLDFAALVSETPYLTSLQREFYSTYLSSRRKFLFEQ